MSREKGEYLSISRRVSWLVGTSGRRRGLSGGSDGLNLHGSDWVHLVRAPQGLGAALGQANVLDLALVLELNKRLHGLLDGRLAVKTVHVVEVDEGEAEPA